MLGMSSSSSSIRGLFARGVSEWSINRQTTTSRSNKLRPTVDQWENDDDHRTSAVKEGDQVLILNPFLVRRSSIVASHREEKTSVYVPLLLSSTPLHSILPMSRAQFRQEASLRLRIAIVLFATRPDWVRPWLSWKRRVCSSRQKRRRNRNMGSSYLSSNFHRGEIRLSRGKQG